MSLDFLLVPQLLRVDHKPLPEICVLYANYEDSGLAVLRHSGTKTLMHSFCALHEGPWRPPGAHPKFYGGWQYFHMANRTGRD